jgi:two-component system cell cycle sensor histidine kinase/response regulator CckA
MELKEGDSPLEGVKRIMVAAKRGAEIVRELMIYSGEDKEDPVEPIDLARLVEEMLELLKVSISKHAVLQTDLGKNLPAVPGRASQIRQIVMNLIINASEAIGAKDGVIRVTISHTILPRPGGANRPGLPSGDYLILEVSDTGGGMTEDAQAKIFDPFFSTKFAGRGLGLAVVQGIVRDHSGAINVVSGPGLGTKFEIFLPCIGDTVPAGHTPVAAVSEKQDWSPAGTVLVVEDEGLLRFAISKMLRMKGLKVIEAMDGFSALELARAHRGEIDVMLLDVTLPGMSSREVLEKAIDIRPNLKVILTSAYSKESVDASFAGFEVEGFVRKPFQIVDLMQLLQQALPT